MKAVELTFKNLSKWSWYNELTDVIDFNQAEDFTLEQLIEKISKGKTAIISTASSIGKSDVKTYFDNGFKVLVLNVKDFNMLRNYQMS